MCTLHEAVSLLEQHGAVVCRCVERPRLRDKPYFIAALPWPLVCDYRRFTQLMDGLTSMWHAEGHVLSSRSDDSGSVIYIDGRRDRRVWRHYTAPFLEFDAHLKFALSQRGRV